MASLIGEDQRPTQRMCLIMAELEDRETGDEGKVREWLARSARAPRDPVWMADGIAASKWAPISPATGRLDAFVWQTPADRLGTTIEANSWIAQAGIAAEPAAAEPPRLVAAPEAAPPPADTLAAEPHAATPEIIAPAKVEKPSFRANGAPASQKVIFPMPAAPDDPGLAEEPEAPAAGDRIGLP